jgi:GSH-dependent disulfide-bond oxidoreductase
MTEDYTPPAIWTWDKSNGGAFAGVNRPTAGAQRETVLPVGEHPIQLYSLGTPNGIKVTIMLEELLALGFAGAEYDAWMIKIFEGDQFGSGFVDINPNSKIPAMMDRSGSEPIRIFESGAMLLHLAEKFGHFLPAADHDHGRTRAEVLSWLFWQVGSAPFMGGGFGHFYHYAPVKIEYAIDRYAMETKRLFDVANNRLKDNRFLGGEDYSIADISAFPWLAAIHSGEAYGEAATFLQVHEYEAVGRWVAEISARPAVQRGRLVNRPVGILERHSASDFAAVPEAAAETAA